MRRDSILRRRVFLLLASAAFLATAMPQPVRAQQALPSGGAVSSGAASITTGGSSVTVTQSSPTAIVNWNSFSIGQGNAVRFENGAGATLNRVTGFSRSQIDGALSATGSVYLVNPSGITVGPTGNVTTGGSFIASTHDVSDAAFHAGGALTFKGNSTASVVNYGSIGALGGDVALIARKVENAGTITAPNGTVALAAGYEVLMRDATLSDGKFVVKVGGADTEAKTSGVIKAAEVELRANGGNVYALAGNTNSVTKANGVASRGGRVFLTAGDGGKVEVSQRVVARGASSGGKAKGGEIRVSGGTAKVSGRLDARGKDAKGGTVVVMARDITLAAGASIDASGSEGGTVLVGGDFQGGSSAVRYLAGTLATAQTTTVAAGATIRADGSAGAGGKVVVWSDARTSFAGAISARGAGSAAGGDAEVSGKAWLDYRGTADLRSDHGAFGTLLLDPYNLTISSATSSGMSGFDANADDSVLNVGTLTAALATANVTVSTGAGGSQAGNITVANAVSWSSGSTLTLQAAGGIALNADVTAQAGGLTLNAGGTITATGGVSVGRFVLGSGNWEQNSASLPTFYARDFTIAGGSFKRIVGGDGQSATPYLIADVYGLQGMGSSASFRVGSWAMANDIDASGTVNWNGGAGFNPVGTSYAPFTGTLDGAEHVISNLYINRPTDHYVGLIGYTNAVTLRNIGLVGGSVTGSQKVGSLVGSSRYGSISNAYATSTVSGTSSVGGLVGEAFFSTISDVYATGTVTGTVLYAGGLVGSISQSSLTNAYATGAVSGDGRVGGLVGLSLANSTITNAFASGRVTGSSAGGLVGELDEIHGVSSITGGYWDVNTSGQQSGVGIGATTGTTGVYSVAGPSQNAFTQSTYSTFDFTNSWFMVDGATRPFLRSEWSTTITNAHQLQLMAMNLGASYTLAKDIDLSMVTQASQMWSSAGFSPVGRGDIMPFTGTFDGAGHVISHLTINRPAANYQGLFGVISDATVRNIGLVDVAVTGFNSTGALVGLARGSAISNAYAKGTVTGSVAVGGLVGGADYGSISDSYAEGAVGGTRSVGGLIGSAGSAVVNPVGLQISNVHAAVAVTGTFHSIGGLVGSATGKVSIGIAYATGTVTGSDNSSDNVGGLLGQSYGAEVAISNAYATGDVSGKYNVGGLVGSGSGVGGGSGIAISNAYATGDVRGASEVGGLVGASGGDIINSYATGAVIGSHSAVGGLVGYAFGGGIINSYATGAVSSRFGYSSDAGGLVAWNDGATVSNSFWNTETTGQRASAGGIGVTTARMRDLSTFTAAGWDIDDAGGTGKVWRIYDGQTGPLLRSFMKSLTVTAGDATKTYDGNTFGGGNGVTYAGFVGGDTPASLGGALVYGGSAQGAVNAGSYLITPTGQYSGQQGYDIKYVSGSLTVDKRALTVTADAQSRTYGDANPGLTYATSGLLGGDSLSGSLATSATSTSNIGTYGITQGTLDNANYAITYAGANLTVNQRALTITADAQSRTYGDSNPTSGGATGNNLVNGDTITGVTLATTATAASGVGTYDLTGSAATGMGLSNYSITYATRTAGLTVDPRALVITAGAQNRIYGDANPATGGATGDNLVNGDSISGVTLSTPATPASGVGTYDLTGSAATGNGLSNYSISYATRSGGLAVTQRTLTVTADAQSRIYGDANPAFTYVMGGMGLANGDGLSGELAGAAVTAGVGTHGISLGSLSAGTNYAITYTGADLTITPRAITVTADAQSRVYGDANPLLTYAVGGMGLVNGDSLSGALASAGVTAGVGVYGITLGTLAHANYAITYAGADLTITPRVITVTADALSRSYGDANGPLTYTVSGMGLANGDSLSGVMATTAGSTSGVGVYGITQGSLAASANYAMTYTGGNLAIIPRAITVTADAQNRYYGEANPALTYRIGGMGLVNGDGLSGALTTDATPTSVAGNYQILQGTLAANANYALTYVAAALTVTDPPKIIVLNEVTAPDQFGAAQVTQKVMQVLNAPTQRASTSDSGCEAGRSCPLVPVASNLPTSQWLSFGSR